MLWDKVLFTFGPCKKLFIPVLIGISSSLPEQEQSQVLVWGLWINQRWATLSAAHDFLVDSEHLNRLLMTSNSWQALMAPNLYPASFQGRNDPPQFFSSPHLLGNYCPTFLEIHVQVLSHFSAKFLHNTQHKNHHFPPRKQMTANKILLRCAV